MQTTVRGAPPERHASGRAQVVWCKSALGAAGVGRRAASWKLPATLEARARRLCFEALHVVTHLQAFTLGRIHAGHLPALLQARTSSGSARAHCMSDLQAAHAPAPRKQAHLCKTQAAMLQQQGLVHHACRLWLPCRGSAATCGLD